MLTRVLLWVVAPVLRLWRWLRAAWSVSAPPVVPRICDRCFYFDYEAGQRALDQNPAFRMVKQVLSPDQVGSAKRKEIDDVAQPVDKPNAITLEKLEGRAHTWEQYGACTLHSRGINRFDHCEQWRVNDRKIVLDSEKKRLEVVS